MNTAAVLDGRPWVCTEAEDRWLTFWLNALDVTSPTTAANPPTTKPAMHASEGEGEHDE